MPAQTKTKKRAPTRYLHAYRSGELAISSQAEIDGTIFLIKGTQRHLYNLLSGNARLAHDGETWLVPGVPEAETSDAAVEALVAFTNRLESKA